MSSAPGRLVLRPLNSRTPRSIHERMPVRPPAPSPASSSGVGRDELHPPAVFNLLFFGLLLVVLIARWDRATR